MKRFALILLILVCSSGTGSGADESFKENEENVFREKRTVPILSDIGKKIVGKTFNFKELAKVSGGVKLTLNKKVLNFANLKIDKSTAVSML